MADFLEAVDSDSGKKEPTPVTLVSGGAEVGTSGNPIPIAAGAGENFIGKVGGTTARVTASFTRPADTTAYASGDLVANSTTAGSVTPMEFTVARGLCRDWLLADHCDQRRRDGGAGGMGC